MTTPTTVHWFRQDLRLHDNKALASIEVSETVLPVYILDTLTKRGEDLGGASKVWLYHALESLDISLGNNLSLYSGNPLEILKYIITQYNITTLVWNRCYEPWRIQRDTVIKQELEHIGITVKSHNSSLLFEPFTITKADDTPYKVFSPFYYKGCLAHTPSEVTPTITHTYYKDAGSLALHELKLLSGNAWENALTEQWDISERGAYIAFGTFIKKGLSNYKEGRNIPSKPYVSKLSPYIHFGNISVHHLWHSVRELEETKDTAHFLSELGWREFAYNQLYHNPSLATTNLQAKFNTFPWKHNTNALECWQQGTTGIPFVDAGMRELWHTGYMHNRVRMVVASFLVKNLLLDWRLGAKWFMDTLFDADLANNSASWQWVAGCGYDSAPYFRVFNPVTQGTRFDTGGEYIKRYIPELQHLPTKYLYAPWEAPAEVLKQANITLGETYPYPIVDIKTSREEALEAFHSLKKKESLS